MMVKVIHSHGTEELLFKFVNARLGEDLSIVFR